MSRAARTLRITRTFDRFHVRLRRIRAPTPRRNRAEGTRITQQFRNLPGTADSTPPPMNQFGTNRQMDLLLRGQFAAGRRETVPHLPVETAAWRGLAQAGNQRRLGGARRHVSQVAAEAVLHCAYSEIDQVGES